MIRLRLLRRAQSKVLVKIVYINKVKTKIQDKTKTKQAEVNQLLHYVSSLTYLLELKIN